jgi:glycosyltransferase involved in cell wall biosynthesis
MVNGFDLYSIIAIKWIIRRIGAPIIQTYQKRASRLTRLPKPFIHVARIGGYHRVAGYYDHADACVGISKAHCDYLVREGLSAKQVYYIGNFVETPKPLDLKELSALRRQLQIPADAIIVFSAGRFIERKGFEDLISAFSRAPATTHGRSVFLMIAGDGPEREKLMEKVKTDGLTSRFRWVGWQKEPSNYYYLSDIFVLPSRIEILGNVFLEAWAHGIPVISTMTPGVAEFMENGINGILVPPSNPQRLADALTDLLKEEPPVWRQMANNALKTMEENCSPPKIIGDYLELYCKLRQRYA